MSFSLPIDVLSKMQITFKVGLPGGEFAFDMVPSKDPAAADGAQSRSGMKLHILANRDSNGATLTLFAADDAHNSSEDKASEYIFGPSLFSNLPPATPSFDLDLPYCDGVTPEPSIPQNFVSDLPTGLDDLLESFNRANDPTVNSAHIKHAEGQESQPVLFSNFDFTPFSEIDFPLAHEFTSSSDSDSPEYSPIATSSASSSFASSPSPRESSSPRARLRRPEPFVRESSAKSTTPSRNKVYRRKFPCTMGCEMDFSRKHDRMRHEVAQHGRVCDWECSTCLGFFSSEETMRKHRCKAVGGGARRLGK
ncbi:hypothetical protein B0H11DRAFT_1983914 [Mycena galericulata]|nr:hypothetical protein B0H11DRAFT_1983914 [Mycena galericulata]